MDDNLLKSLSNYVTPDLVSQASDTLGESKTAIFNTLSSIVPSILAGILNQSNNTESIDQIVILANNEQLESSKVLANLDTQISNNRDLNILEIGKTFLKLLFGNKQSGLFDIIGGAAQVKKTTVSRLMLMAAPMTLAYLKKSQYSASQLISTIKGEKAEILKSTPAGLQEYLTQNTGVSTKTTKKTTSIKKRTTEEPKNRWILPFLILVASLLLYYILLM